MSRGYKEVIGNTYTSGTNFTTFTTAKSVLPPEGLVTVPQGYFNIGRRIKVDVQGAIGTLVTTPGLIVFQVMLGTVVVLTTGNIQLNATAHTTIPFWAEFILTARTFGATTVGTFMGQGKVDGIMFTPTAAQIDGVNSHAMMLAPNTNPVVGTGFDSTAAQTIDFWAGFTISNAANSIRIDQYSVTAEN